MDKCRSHLEVQWNTFFFCGIPLSFHWLDPTVRDLECPFQETWDYSLFLNSIISQLGFGCCCTTLISETEYQLNMQCRFRTTLTPAYLLLQEPACPCLASCSGPCFRCHLSRLFRSVSVRPGMWEPERMGGAPRVYIIQRQLPSVPMCTFRHECTKESNAPRRVVWLQNSMIRKTWR